MFHSCMRVCAPPVNPAPLPSSELPRHAGRSRASDEEDASDVGNADSLCRGPERSQRFAGVIQTRSEAVQEQPVILTRAPSPRRNSVSRFISSSAWRIGRRLRCVLVIEPASVYGLYHLKACAVPVYRAPAKGKQFAYANAADTNQPHHCTVGFREFVKQTRQLALVQFEQTVPVAARSRDSVPLSLLSSSFSVHL